MTVTSSCYNCHMALNYIPRYIRAIRRLVSTSYRSVWRRLSTHSVPMPQPRESLLASLSWCGMSRLPWVLDTYIVSRVSENDVPCIPYLCRCYYHYTCCYATCDYLAAICGDIMTVPGLPTRPGFYDVDMDLDTGRVIGLF